MLFYLPLFVNHFALVMFALLLMWAAISDVQNYLIPNRICLAILGLYPVHVLTAAMPVSPLDGLAVAAGTFVLGAALFGLRLLGGGDVKMLAAVTLWAGSSLLLPFLLVTAVCGGVLALLLMTPLRHRVPAPPAPAEGEIQSERLLMPYGVAIAGGGLFVIVRLLGT